MYVLQLVLCVAVVATSPYTRIDNTLFCCIFLRTFIVLNALIILWVCYGLNDFFTYTRLVSFCVFFFLDFFFSFFYVFFFFFLLPDISMCDFVAVIITASSISRSFLHSVNADNEHLICLDFCVYAATRFDYFVYFALHFYPHLSILSLSRFAKRRQPELTRVVSTTTTINILWKKKKSDTVHIDNGILYSLLHFYSYLVASHCIYASVHL